MEQQIIISTSPEETEALAQAIGQRCRGGELIELVSDLGGGKTTFVRGLAAGLGSSDPVASPTFTISREYHGGRHIIHHYDFYRLSEPGVIAHELQDVLQDLSAVVVIEWADVVANVLPDRRLRVRIDHTGEMDRQITLECNHDIGYLIKDLR